MPRMSMMRGRSAILGSGCVAEMNGSVKRRTEREEPIHTPKMRAGTAPRKKPRKARARVAGGDVVGRSGAGAGRKMRGGRGGRGGREGGGGGAGGGGEKERRDDARAGEKFPKREKGSKDGQREGRFPCRKGWECGGTHGRQSRVGGGGMRGVERRHWEIINW